jgi:hypothetical protein
VRYYRYSTNYFIKVSMSEEDQKTQDPLNNNQVDYAYELISELHPLDTFPIYDAFPYLRPISSRCCHGIPFCKPRPRDYDDA